MRVDLSRLIARQGNLVAANREAAEAVRLDPSNAAAHNQRGMLLEAQGDVAGATRAYRRALELRPDFPQVQRNLQRIGGVGAAP